MKVLHIGDIHLGCQLDNLRRHEEFEKVFAFLAEAVRNEGIEAALFAGDIFDSGAPSNESRALYYRFLVRLRNDLNDAIMVEDYERASVLRDQIAQMEQKTTGAANESATSVKRGAGVSEGRASVSMRRGILDIIGYAPYAVLFLTQFYHGEVDAYEKRVRVDSPRFAGRRRMNRDARARRRRRLVDF